MEWYPLIKRGIDILLSFIGLIILIPMYVILALLIKLDSKGPVLFKQKRVGKYKKHFYILKFRTMRTDTPNNIPTHKLNDPDIFITKIGRFLRKTSIDELPQIINILIGDMSIVGPRPALWNQYDLIDKRDQFGANDIYPGLTGWAQINGRDELSIENKAQLDGEYVRNMSFLFDCKCVIKTIFRVLRNDGIIEGGNKVKEKSATIKGE